MQLYFKKYGSSGKPILILHGLFGMSDNWHNIARQLSEKHLVYTVDQRNHGQSPHSSVMNFSAMADDVWELMASENLSRAILIGHSMGGKTAMTFAGKYPEKVEKLVVVDIAPRAYKASHQMYFDAFRSIDLNSSSRKSIEEKLAERIPDPGELLFLLKNLDRKEDGTFRLKINLETIERSYFEISNEVTYKKPLSIPTCFIRGEYSNYIRSQDEEGIKSLFSRGEIATVEAAGHWVHAENPGGFLKVLNEFLDRP